jgi:hypothetical protein
MSGADADFDTPVRVAAAHETLILQLGSWEGPLDLLLMLARAQKVDLAQISILALVDQYLDFIRDAKALSLELAADYLVMAAWLAYLKSLLLLPKDPEAEPDPAELALKLQFQLQRLEAMRDAAARLVNRNRLGRDVMARGIVPGDVQRGGRQVEGGHVMPGLGLIGGHAAAHVAQADEGDASHLCVSLMDFGRGLAPPVPLRQSPI